MALDLVDYERKAHEAVRAFWGNREAAKKKQIEAGKADQGERAGVTGGKNMDDFMALVLDIVRAIGLPTSFFDCGFVVLAHQKGMLKNQFPINFA